LRFHCDTVRIAFLLVITLHPVTFVSAAAGHALFLEIQDDSFLSTYHGWSVGYHILWIIVLGLIILHHAKTYIKIAAAGGFLNMCTGKMVGWDWVAIGLTCG
tara:strand:+ start:15 stop:320 length:306 start_codon:yes stop_codon:yes gene_type:complete